MRNPFENPWDEHETHVRESLESECDRLTGELTRARAAIQRIKLIANVVAKRAATMDAGEAILRECEAVERA